LNCAFTKLKLRATLFMLDFNNYFKKYACNSKKKKNTKSIIIITLVKATN